MKVPAVAAVDAAEAVLVLATRVATLGERTGRADLEPENDKDEGAGALVLVRTIGTARLAPHDWQLQDNCRTTTGQLVALLKGQGRVQVRMPSAGVLHVLHVLPLDTSTHAECRCTACTPPRYKYTRPVQVYSPSMYTCRVQVYYKYACLSFCVPQAGTTFGKTTSQPVAKTSTFIAVMMMMIATPTTTALNQLTK